jgi:DNA-binding transcriptional LysR family regulator
LECFLAVAGTLHFGRAAEQLGIAQPALSRQIQRLECELGVALFARTRRSVQLTAAGAAFEPAARAIVLQVEAAAREVHEVAAGRLGRLRIGFVGSAALSALPVIVRAFSASFPGITLDLHELTTAQQLAALAARRIDVGLMRAHAPVRGIQVERLLAEPLVVALPNTARLARAEAVAIADLRDEPWVMFPRSEGSGFHEQLLSICRAAQFEPVAVQEATQMQTLVGLVAGGIGVALAPASATRIQPAGIAYRPLAGQQDTVPLLLGRRSDEISPTIEHFLGCARALRDSGALAQSVST